MRSRRICIRKRPHESIEKFYENKMLILRGFQKVMWKICKMRLRFERKICKIQEFLLSLHPENHIRKEIVKTVI